MRVEPETPDHPKFVRLKRRIGDLAMECLIRVWAHCQNSQRGGTWRGVDAEYLECVARWTGPAGELYAALKESGWVEEARNALVIHDWDRMNARAKANWDNGQKGGRPGLTQDRNQLLLGKPKSKLGYPNLDLGKPTGNPNQAGLPQYSTDQYSTSSEGDPQTPRKKSGRSAVAESRTRFAALKARIAEFEAQGLEELTDPERAELSKMRADLAALTRDQAAGKFS